MKITWSGPVIFTTTRDRDGFTRTRPTVLPVFTLFMPGIVVPWYYGLVGYSAAYDAHRVALLPLNWIVAAAEWLWREVRHPRWLR